MTGWRQWLLDALLPAAVLILVAAAGLWSRAGWWIAGALLLSPLAYGLGRLVRRRLAREPYGRNPFDSYLALVIGLLTLYAAATAGGQDGRLHIGLGAFAAGTVVALFLGLWGRYQSYRIGERLADYLGRLLPPRQGR